MTFDLWDHQFCLACDKQVDADGAAYCSEFCRLSDFERTASSSPSSIPGSPSRTPSAYSWAPSSSPPPVRTKFYLSPAYDFSNAQPYGSTPSQPSFFGNYTFASSVTELASPANRRLTPSSSQSSLVSLQSTSTASAESTQLSDTAKQELRAYAVSFDQVRLQRRRSN